MSRYLSADDPAAAVASLRKAFVGTPIWYGHYTCHFWALVGNGFVEAIHPAELAQLLDNARVQRTLRKDPPTSSGRIVRLPPTSGPYGPPMMSEAARLSPSLVPGRGGSRAAAPSLARLRPRRHRIGSWLPAAAW
jgi:hypothetical protein